MCACLLADGIPDLEFCVSSSPLTNKVGIDDTLVVTVTSKEPISTVTAVCTVGGSSVTLVPASTGTSNTTFVATAQITQLGLTGPITCSVNGSDFAGNQTFGVASTNTSCTTTVGECMLSRGIMQPYSALSLSLSLSGFDNSLVACLD